MKNMFMLNMEHWVGWGKGDCGQLFDGTHRKLSWRFFLFLCFVCVCVSVRCHLERLKLLKSLNTGRCIWFADLPEILMAPQNQTIKLGKAFVLECDADGNPLPSITWQFNGNPLTSSANDADLLLENENTELVVSVAKQQHAGKQ